MDSSLTCESVPILPSEDESALYYANLSSHPRLLARTDGDTWDRQTARYLGPIEDASIIRQWTSDLRKALVREGKDVQWTALLPVRVCTCDISWEREKSDTYANVLFICVARSSTSAVTAWKLASHCQQILHSFDINNMHVETVEMDVVHLVGSKKDDKPADPPTTNTTLSPVQDAFDSSFSEMPFAGGFIDDLTPQVNSAIARLLPFPGQAIMQVPQKGNEEAPGSVGLFLRLGDGGPTYALTSRHVTVRQRYDHFKDYRAALHSPSDTPIVMAWGSENQLANSLHELKELQQAVSVNFAAMELNYYKTGRNEECFLLRKRCKNDYLPALTETVREVSAEAPGAAVRHFGHVAYAAKHAKNSKGGWSDWALVDIQNTGIGKQTSTQPSAGHCKFYTNHVHIDARFCRDFLRLSVRCPEIGKIVEKIDEHCFLRLLPPLDSLTLQRPSHDTPQERPSETRPGPMPRAVFKCGAKTGFTVGLPSAIGAVIRTPLPDEPNATVHTWPVFGFPEYTQAGSSKVLFSAPGDAGSCVFDGDGRIVGIVDGGLGSKTHANVVFMTPIELILDEIENVTGEKPHVM